MKSKRIVKVVLMGVATCAMIAGIALGGIVWSISQSVSEYAAMAQRAHPHPGDDLAALVDFMNSDEHSLPDRNHAIWVIGRLSDPDAIPALDAVYTGAICDHENALCQYELEKAIVRCGGTPDPPRKSKASH